MTKTENICECGHKHINNCPCSEDDCKCLKFTPRIFKHKIVDVRVIKNEDDLKKAIEEEYFANPPRKPEVSK